MVVKLPEPEELGEVSMGKPLEVILNKSPVGNPLEVGKVPEPKELTNATMGKPRGVVMVPKPKALRNVMMGKPSDVVQFQEPKKLGDTTMGKLEPKDSGSIIMGIPMPMLSKENCRVRKNCC